MKTKTFSEQTTSSEMELPPLQLPEKVFEELPPLQLPEKVFEELPPLQLPEKVFEFDYDSYFAKIDAMKFNRKTKLGSQPKLGFRPKLVRDVTQRREWFESQKLSGGTGCTCRNYNCTLESRGVCYSLDEMGNPFIKNGEFLVSHSDQGRMFQEYIVREALGILSPRMFQEYIVREALGILSPI